MIHPLIQSKSKSRVTGVEGNVAESMVGLSPPHAQKKKLLAQTTRIKVE
jgi:hypothetical protein